MMRIIRTVLLTLALAMGLAGAGLAVRAEDPPPPAPAAAAPAGAHGNTITRHAIANFVPVTDAMLQKPAPSDWAMFRGNYRGWGYSPLHQVNKTNVKQLGMIWSRAMEPGVNESTPLVINGIMFLGNSADVIQAIDAATGDLMWEYRRKLPTIEQLHGTWGQRKRSIFVYGDKVYFASWDNFIVALDARTGKTVWETDRGGDLYATNTSGPIVVKGVVIAGSNCQIAGFGCYVTGHDANTGKELWRNTFIPKVGEPGDETWGGMPFDKRWITGAWGPITYDPDLDLVFYGSSAIGPASEAERNQIGLTPAGTDTRYAVRPADGKIIWKRQVLKEDNWDDDCVFDMMSVDAATHPDAKAEGMLATGKGVEADVRKTLVGAPCKNAIVWSLDAATGKFLWAKQTTYQNMVTGIDSKGEVTINQDITMRDVKKPYHVCPTAMGGRDEAVSAYSPKSHTFFIQLQNLCWEKSVIRYDREPKPEYSYNLVNTWGMAPGKTNVGRIDAIDVETGKTRWSWETQASNYSPVLATGGGLVFNGGMDRYLRALDQDTGQLLWQTRLASQAFGTTVSYSVNGRQYVAITAGGGFNGQALPFSPGVDAVSGNNAVYVFALPQ